MFHHGNIASLVELGGFLMNHYIMLSVLSEIHRDFKIVEIE